MKQVVAHVTAPHGYSEQDPCRSLPQEGAIVNSLV